jgi:hypothetical protein
VIDHHGAWLPSASLGVPTIAALIAALLLFLFIVWRPRWNSDRTEKLILSGLPVLFILGLTVGSAFGYYPFRGDYHRLQPASGTVQAVDSRFFAASQYVVVTYDTGLTVRCDDSRCATVRPGETLNLLCTKEHQFGSPLAADGWACRWGQQ